MCEANVDSGVASSDELKIIADMVTQLTGFKIKECGHLCIEEFSSNLFARLLSELSMHKRGMFKFINHVGLQHEMQP